MSSSAVICREILGNQDDFHLDSIGTISGKLTHLQSSTFEA